MNSKALAGAGAGAAVAGAAAGFGIYQAQWPTAQLYGATICRVPQAEGLLALTYDDGPNPEYTPRLMRVLERYDAKATFFLIGKWANREPALAREVVAAGHAIGNHTFTHPRMPFLSVARVRDELMRCREAVEAAGIEFSRVDGAALMRPPFGSRRPATLRTLRDEGYVPVLWSLTGYDWRKRITAEKIAEKGANAKAGDVFLLHDGSHLEHAADRSRSIAATEAHLAHYTAEGYRFVTIPELAAAGRPR